MACRSKSSCETDVSCTRSVEVARVSYADTASILINNALIALATTFATNLTEFNRRLAILIDAVIIINQITLQAFQSLNTFSRKCDDGCQESANTIRLVALNFLNIILSNIININISSVPPTGSVSNLENSVTVLILLFQRNIVEVVRSVKKRCKSDCSKESKKSSSSSDYSCDHRSHHKETKIQDYDCDIEFKGCANPRCKCDNCKCDPCRCGSAEYKSKKGHNKDYDFKEEIEIKVDHGNTVYDFKEEVEIKKECKKKQDHCPPVPEIEAKPVCKKVAQKEACKKDRSEVSEFDVERKFDWKKEFDWKAEVCEKTQHKKEKPTCKREHRHSRKCDEAVDHSVNLGRKDLNW